VIRHARGMALGGLLLVAAAQSAFPQGRATPSDDGAHTGADEAFDLDIADRRIVERDFHAATDVEAGGREQGWNLRIGAAVTAREIDVRLRGIHGHVRFRGSLAQVLEPIPPRGRAPGRPEGRGRPGR
jgi:hypothetical protein